MTNTHDKYFYRSLSPCSFERLRQEGDDYFYRPKRGPSVTKSNKTITRPIKVFETVTNLVDLLSKGNLHDKKQIEDNEQTTKSTNPSQYSSLLSMDAPDLTSSSCSSSHSTSSTYSSRSNSIISEHESQMTLIEPTTQIKSKPKPKPIYSFPICRIPTIGMNITCQCIHIVLLELYPQNTEKFIVEFQQHMISLIIEYEHKNWSITNVELRTKFEQQANFRLFSLTFEQFDSFLQSTEQFLHSNSCLISSLVLNIVLTGERIAEYEKKISSYLNKINLNFDLIQSRAETYMIGIEFFLDNHYDECFDIFENDFIENKQDFYPYLLIHAEVQSTIIYIVHSSSQYSILTINNLCYQTYSNLLQLLHPNFHDDLPSSSPSSSMMIRRTPPISLDDYQSQIPLTSLTRIPSQYFPIDYSHSKTCHYIYRGWSNRRTSLSNPNLVAYDVSTQTDDSFLISSSQQIRLAMQRSLSSMFTMNLALMIKLILKIYSNIRYCVLIGEYFQIEQQAKQDLGIFLRTILHDCQFIQTPRFVQLQRQSFISAFGCVLPRVYFDIIHDEKIRGEVV